MKTLAILCGFLVFACGTSTPAQNRVSEVCKLGTSCQK